MDICIIGWYGSETLGDRAILDGIIYIFSGLDKKLNIRIGSLYPILTERTIWEDKSFYSRHCKTMNIKCFDVRNKPDLHANIKSSHIVIMGGGPLMDLVELYIIQHAFKYAKRMGVPTALIGCGYGPLKRKEYIKCVKNIIKYSDLIIMRSKACKYQMESLAKSTGNLYDSMDPAELSVIAYLEEQHKISHPMQSTGWIMNIRDLGYVYGGKYTSNKIETLCVEKVLSQVNYLTLFPMHTFAVGGDDRYIQGKMVRKFSGKGISAIQKPLSLRDVYELIFHAEGCIGMRYHSVVFQTYLNGNNYIIDYTEPKLGKISSFLDRIDKNHFYNNRYYNIFDMTNQFFSINSEKKTFSYDIYNAQKSLVFYRECINDILKGINK